MASTSQGLLLYQKLEERHGTDSPSVLLEGINNGDILNLALEPPEL